MYKIKQNYMIQIIDGAWHIQVITWIEPAFKVINSLVVNMSCIISGVAGNCAGNRLNEINSGQFVESQRHSKGLLRELMTCNSGIRMHEE